MALFIKSLKTFALLLITLASLEAADRELKPGQFTSLPESFSDYEALKKWAKTSSFGSGFAKKLETKKFDIFYSLRSRTGGVATAELVFYTSDKNCYIHPKLIMPMHYAEYRILVDGDNIVIERWKNDIRTFVQVMYLKLEFFAKDL